MSSPTVRATTVTTQELAERIRGLFCVLADSGDMREGRAEFLADPGGIIDFYELMGPNIDEHGHRVDHTAADDEVARNAISIIAVEYATDGVDLPEYDEDAPLSEDAAEVVDELDRHHAITDAYVLDPGPGTVHIPTADGSAFLSDLDGSHPDGTRGHVVGRCFLDGSDEQILWIDRHARSITGAITMLAGLARHARMSAGA